MLAWPFPLIALIELIALEAIAPSCGHQSSLRASRSCTSVAGLHGSRLSMLGGMSLAAAFLFLLRRFSPSRHDRHVTPSSSLVYSLPGRRDSIATALSGASGLRRRSSKPAATWLAAPRRRAPTSR
jgi:hypothetical protein